MSPTRTTDSTLPLSSRFDDALTYATRLHTSQVRKGSTIPYISHLLAVSSLVIEDGGDEDEAIAALLHDAIEDHPRNGKTSAEIRSRYGERVLEIVEALTDAFTQPQPPWRDRKQAYLARVKHHGASAQRVSLADKFHNARSILTDFREVGDAVWNRFAPSREDTLWYYRALVDAHRKGGPSRLLAELDRVVTELEREVGGRV
jgi:(p)ppGpp synthase/HD superfamily hydrolase